MSVEFCHKQPMTPGSFFRLPPELRDIIYEMAIFNPSPRLCPMSYDQSTRVIKQYQNDQVLGTGTDALFVFDYPKLRHVSRDVRYETARMYDAVGYQFPPQGPPTRPYDPEIDILYPKETGFHEYLCASADLLKTAGPASPTCVHAQQVRKARHIAIQYSSNYACEPRPRMHFHWGSEQNNQRRALRCRHVERVSIIIPDVGPESKIQSGCWDKHLCQSNLPMRPCTLGGVTRLSTASDTTISNYSKRWHNERVCSRAEGSEVLFPAGKGDAARQLEIQRLRRPQPAMLLKMTKPSTAEGGEEWEEASSGDSQVDYYATKPYE